MPRVLIAVGGVCLLLGVLLGLMPPAWAEGRAALSFSGQQVTFAYWDRQAEGLTFDQIALSPERRAHYAEAGEDRVIGLLRWDVHFRADGNVEEFDLLVQHLLTPAAVRRHGTDNHWVDAFAETLTIEQAYTLLPNGRSLWVDPSTLQLKPDSDDDIFTDNFEVVLPFPGVKPGAATVLATRTLTRNNDYPLPYARILYPQVTTPMERLEVRITWDETVAAPVWKTDFEDLTCRETAPREVRCQAEQIAAYPRDPDILYRDVLPTLVIGETTSWPDIAERMRTLVASAYSDDSVLDEELAELLQGAGSDDERLARIHGLVSQEVRYLGLEHGLGGIIPRNTATTLARRFGDCKDKAALFIDLARRAGFEAYAVLTSTNRANPDKLLIPASVYFNHMIACVRLPGESSGAPRELCLDLTDPYSAYDVLSEGGQGAVRLDLITGAPGPHQLPGERFTWRMDVETDITLNADGSLDEDQSQVYHGANAAWLRSRLQPKSAAERREWLEEDFEDGHGKDMELLSFDLTGIDQADSSARIETRSHLKDSFDPDDFKRFSDWEAKLEIETKWLKSDNEAHDVTIAGLKYHSVVRYRLPPSHRVAHHGAELDFVSEFGRFERHYRDDAGDLVVVSEITLPRSVIALERLADFNRFIDHILANERITFDVTPADGDTKSR